MQAKEERSACLGLSPCPNDTFIFHALLHGLVLARDSEDLRWIPKMADVERLNRHALNADYEVTKLSLGVVPHVQRDYALLSSGAALGWGCGPLLVAKQPLSGAEMRKASVAIPGRFTTANALLDLRGGFEGSRKEMLFSRVMEAVETGETDMGLIIHEGRFTYERHGLVKLLDMGEWWESEFHMPLPLGVIAVRRDIAEDLALAIQEAIAASLRHAWQNPEASREFVRENAREMESSVTEAHIKTFVTPFSHDLGESGKDAIRMLVERACEKRGLEPVRGLFLQDRQF